MTYKSINGGPGNDHGLYHPQKKKTPILNQSSTAIACLVPGSNYSYCSHGCFRANLVLGIHHYQGCVTGASKYILYIQGNGPEFGCISFAHSLLLREFVGSFHTSIKYIRLKKKLI